MRGLELLHPYAREKAEQLVKECKKRGLKIQITETFRTKKEQESLYASGRTKKGSIVTNANYPASNHCWGIAFDFCRADGKPAFDNQDGFFQKIGKVGKEMGLYWGGDFKSITDLPHFEIHKFGTWKELKQKHGTPDQFKKSW